MIPAPAADRPFPKRVLIVHNRYKQAGGEDSVFESERDLLASKGHEVETLEFDNHEVDALPKWKTAAEAIWSVSARRKLAAKIAAFPPGIVHFHNTFLRVSPAAYWTCRTAGVPVVQTLHNYRLLCLNALFLRNGRPCEDCLGKSLPWPGLAHKCYHGSAADSALVAGVRVAHNLIGSYANAVDAFIALTRFGKGKFVRGGLPADRIHVKPNFVRDIGKGAHAGGFCLFAGRLSQEKGIETLLEAWKHLDGGVPLKVAGAGPLQSLLADPPPGVTYLGSRTRDEIFALMRDASLLMVPSGCYEGFPVTLPEAFSTGLPVAASRLGTMEEILEGEETGWFFPPWDPVKLAETVRAAWADPEGLRRKGAAGRVQYESRYCAEANYGMLMGIYAAAAANAGAKRRPGRAAVAA
jgi:glycosyltransferase involved in cell wall biosynthesis